jgi:hypothetical protein
MRLLAAARGANLYHITRDDHPVATLHLKVGGASRAELADGRALHLRREDPLGGRFTIIHDQPATREAPATLLRASRPNPLRRAYEIEIEAEIEIELASRHITLRAESPWRGDYLVLERDELTGAIRPVSARSRDAAADLPDDLPLEAAVALLWLVLALWRQGHARVDSL